MTKKTLILSLFSLCVVACSEQRSSVQEKAREAAESPSTLKTRQNQEIEEHIRSLVKTDEESKAKTRKALVAFREKALPSLNKAMSDQHEIVQKNALAIIGSIATKSDKAVLILTENISAEEEFLSVRLIGMDWLATLGSRGEAAIPGLQKNLKDENIIVRRRALSVLPKISNYDPKILIPILSGFLREESISWPESLEALKILVMLPQNKQVLAILMDQAAQRRKSEVQIFALKEIEKYGDKALPSYITILNSPGVSNTAYHFITRRLCKVGPEAEAALPNLFAVLRKTKDSSLIPKLMKTIESVGRPAVPHLVSFLKLKNLDHGRRKLAGEILIKYHATDYEQIIDMINNAPPTARTGICYLLSEIKKPSPKLLPGILLKLKGGRDKYLKHTLLQTVANMEFYANTETEARLDEILRVAMNFLKEGLPSVVSILVKIGPKAKVPLIQALKDRNSTVRINAAKALAYCAPNEPETVNELLKTINDPDKNVAVAAWKALFSLKSKAEAAIPVMIVKIEKVDTWKSFAFRLLKEIGKASIDPLLRLLDTQSGRLQASSIGQCLKKIGPDSKSALPTLTKMLRSQKIETSVAASNVLGMLGSLAREALPSLEKVAKHKNKFVRSAANEAIDKINK